MRATICVLILWCVAAGLAYGWSDPILVTPDTATSLQSRVVFDNEGYLHVFFANRRYQTAPYWPHYDLFHCKMTQNGVRLGEDTRIDTTCSLDCPYPSPIFGSDGKLHVAWNEFLAGPWMDQNGVYYARLDVQGHIEREPTRIASGGIISPPRLLMDSEGNLNTVWGRTGDSLMYCKFDTSGQILISPVLIHADIYSNLEACMDNLNRIHMTYRHYWGSWNDFNVGYSRVDNQGQVEVLYFPLIPEEPGTYAGRSDIAADDQGNLYLGYMSYQNGAHHHHYRKLDPQLNTLFDLLVDTATLGGTQIGSGDLVIDGLGQVTIVWAHNYNPVPLDFRSAVYSTNGQLLQEAQVVVTGDENWNPDLAAGPDGFLAFTWAGPWPGVGSAKILYSYAGRPEGIGPAVSLEMAPAGATVLPASGGALRFTLTLQNYEVTTQRAQIWTVTRLPDNSWLGPIWGPMGLTLPGNWSLTRLRVQVVPGHAPAGTYWYEGRIGSYPDSIWACDGLAFTKLGTGGLGLGGDEWANTGEDFTVDVGAHSSPRRTPLQAEEFSVSTLPNPFNPSTVLSFELRDASSVKLAVYDISGRLVATLADGWREAGEHEIMFDGTVLPSGLYICRFQAREFEAVQKLILLK
jgi:hypothetical protein